MFYLILAMLLVLFYIFAAPNNIRGTINLMVAIIMFMIAFWAMWDIHHLDKPNTKRSSRTKRDTY